MGKNRTVEKKTVSNRIRHFILFMDMEHSWRRRFACATPVPLNIIEFTRPCKISEASLLLCLQVHQLTPTCNSLLYKALAHPSIMILKGSNDNSSLASTNLLHPRQHGQHVLNTIPIANN